MSLNLNKQQKITQEVNESQENDIQQNDHEKSDISDNKVSKNFEKAMTLPVRDQLQKLEDIVAQVQKDLETSRKDMNFLHSKLGSLRNDYLDEFLFLSNNLLNEKNRLVQELRKSAVSEQHEIDFYNQQLVQLRYDKEKLDQTTDSLHLRTQACENDVGFRYVYD